MGVEGTRVRDISCTFIPGEEAVFSLCEAPRSVSSTSMPVSRSAVQAMNVFSGCGGAPGW